MNSIVLLLCLVSAALSLPQHGGRDATQPAAPTQSAPLKPTTPPVPIIALSNNINFDGSYNYNFEGGDGTRAEQNGQLKQIGNEAGEVSQGSYSYVGDDGKTYSVSYIADETGYHPIGDHLPQPPPTPDYILKSLEILATAPPFHDEYAQPEQQKQQQYQPQQQQQQQYQPQQQQQQQQQYQPQQQPQQQQQYQQQQYQAQRQNRRPKF